MSELCALSRDVEPVAETSTSSFCRESMLQASTRHTPGSFSCLPSSRTTNELSASAYASSCAMQS